MLTLAVSQEPTEGLGKCVGRTTLFSSHSLLFVSMARNQLFFPSSRRKMLANRSIFWIFFLCCACFSTFLFEKKFHPQPKLKETPVVGNANRGRHLLVKLRALNTRAIKHLFKITNRSRSSVYIKEYQQIRKQSLKNLEGKTETQEWKQKNLSQKIG